MTTWNPELCAVNEVRREAEEAGVLLDYWRISRGKEVMGHPLSIQERQELVKQLVAKTPPNRKGAKP